jgi:hypothetical protein
MLGSQSTSLTPNISFSHNLCFKSPNWWCEPIFDIYVSIFFQWYKELFKATNFVSCNCALKIQDFIWDSNSQHGGSLGNVRVHSFTLFAFSGACYVTPGSFSWPTTLQPFVLVANPRLGLRRLYNQGWQQFKWKDPRKSKDETQVQANACEVRINESIEFGWSWGFGLDELSAWQEWWRWVNFWLVN